MPLRSHPFALRPLRAGVLVAALSLAAPAAHGVGQPDTYRGSRLVPRAQSAWCSEARGAATGIGLAGQKLRVKTKSDPAKNEFEFSTEKKIEALLAELDPRTGFTLLVTGDGGAGDRSRFVTLDPSLWQPIGKGSPPKGWKYKDKAGSRGGVRTAKIEKGQLKIQAKGADLGFEPDGTDAEVWVHVSLGNQSYCAQFGGTIQDNQVGAFKARDAAAPAACPAAVCGDNVQDVGEACDDGDLDPDDGCANDCSVSECQGEAFASTFEAIQKVILDGYGCTSSLCHGTADPTHDSGLKLLPSPLDPNDTAGLAAVLDANHQALLTAVPANNPNFARFAVEGDSKTSLLWAALFFKTHCTPANPTPPAECDALEDGNGAALVEGMPEGATLLPQEVEAIDLWLRGGAPRDLVVAGTADKLDSCLPPADPLKIDPPPAPGAGAGVQFVSSAWSLPSQSENEICFPIWYDFSQTNLIPEDQQLDCPPEYNFGPLNAGNKCFRYHRQLLLQDPQSHHSIVHIYTGQYGTDHNAWQPWTYKYDDPAAHDPEPPCDPLDVDPALGFNRDCSGRGIRTPACINYGPPDFNPGGFPGQPSTAPQFSGSQETHYEQAFAPGVYSVLPMKGIVVFNSHAFNLTEGDTTMNQYLNLWLAGPGDQQYQTQQIFESDQIFIQTVPPFETREYCSDMVLPDHAQLFWLSSHTHRHGIRWRTWGPPNVDCAPNQDGVPDGTPANECVPGSDDQLVYYSTVYNDPVQLAIDPPVPFTGSADDRRFVFCALYDNGATPTSPSVKRQSTSPVPPPIGPVLIGGPCEDAELACISPDPAKQGQLCGSQPDPDRFCDSAPGAFDGLCDACPLNGGFTTEDEMFIQLGNFYVAP